MLFTKTSSAGARDRYWHLRIFGILTLFSSILTSCGRNHNEVSFDDNRDGRPDRWEFWQNDSLIRVETDRNHDGNVDMIEHYSSGEISRTVCDDSFGGVFNITWEYANGVLAKTFADVDENGIADYITVFSNGVPRASVYMPNQQILLSFTEYKNGFENRVIRDVDGDGLADIVEYCQPITNRLVIHKVTETIMMNLLYTIESVNKETSDIDQRIRH